MTTDWTNSKEIEKRVEVIEERVAAVQGDEPRHPKNLHRDYDNVRETRKTAVRNKMIEKKF